MVDCCAPLLRGRESGFGQNLPERRWGLRKARTTARGTRLPLCGVHSPHGSLFSCLQQNPVKNPNLQLWANPFQTRFKPARKPVSLVGFDADLAERHEC